MARNLPTACLAAFHGAKEMRESEWFLGLNFHQVTASTALQTVLQLAQSPQFSYLLTPNVDHIVKLHRNRNDRGLWRCYLEANLCLCDSRILQMLAGWSGIDLHLVPGSDLTAMLLDQPAELTRSISVVGGSPEMVHQLRNLFPGRNWKHHNPPMGIGSDPVAQEHILQFVEETRSDITFFAIGAPQSELLCSRLAERRVARGIALCIGASLEFLTGQKTRAPILMQKLKLEWLFRLLSEPRRLATRYLLDGPEIFRIWLSWHRNRHPA